MRWVVAISVVIALASLLACQLPPMKFVDGPTFEAERQRERERLRPVAPTDARPMHQDAGADDASDASDPSDPFGKLRSSGSFFP